MMVHEEGLSGNFPGVFDIPDADPSDRHAFRPFPARPWRARQRPHSA